MAMEWPDDLSIDLINRVRENENLWDPHHPHKKRNAMKVDIWKKISEEVEKPVLIVPKISSWQEGQVWPGVNEGLRITWFAYETIHSFMNDVYKPHGNTDVVSNLLYSFFNYH